MQNFLTFLFLVSSLSCFSQSSYDLFESYNTEILKNRNSTIEHVTGLRDSKDTGRKIISYEEFSKAGLPVKVTRYDENSNELSTTEFVYTGFEQPFMIHTFQDGKKFTTSEFYYDSAKTLKYFKDYVYSSLDGQKMLIWQTNFEYHANKKVKTITRLEVSDILPKRDTAEISYFDTAGVKTKSRFDLAGYKQTLIYKWNPDKTEMLEYEYNAGSIERLTWHKYKAGFEIERIEQGSKKPLVFWKYDKQDRLIQTNSALYFTRDLIYDTAGYLIKESWTATFPELVKDNDPKIMRFSYEYKFRK